MVLVIEPTAMLLRIVLRCHMRKSKQPSLDDEYLNTFVTFSGTISRGDLVVPIRFRARFGADGELRFRVYPIPLTRKTLGLWSERGRRSTRSALYTVSAISAAGTRFESDGIILKSSRTRATATTAHVILGFSYTRVTFMRDRDNQDSSPAIRWALRGFECFPPVKSVGGFGTLTMRGD